MDNLSLSASFSSLATPLVADACVRLALPLRIAPPGMLPLIAGSHLAGRALPVKHYGSVDIFLEAIDTAQTGDVLVIDNQGRSDEACIGDLTTLEAQAAGLAGVIVWGCHRDTAELLQIGFPVFSYGAWPAGPTRLDTPPPDRLESAELGAFSVGRADYVFADQDGVLFVRAQHVEEVMRVAQAIWNTEREQAAALTAGKTLREQLRFGEYLVKRSANPALSFREHLRAIGGAIEE